MTFTSCNQQVFCDKEGTEVFEGDILHHQIQTEYTFIVKYDKDKGRWYGDGLSRTYRIDITKDFLQYYKVIGNIYETGAFGGRVMRPKISVHREQNK